MFIGEGVPYRSKVVSRGRVDPYNPPLPLSAGTRLGPYEVVAPLGAGGMGEVYRARDTRLGRDVAVKVLPAPMAGDIEFRERFEFEAHAVARLRHPNILALHDIGEADGLRFIVTELVEGEPLRGPVPLRKLLDIAAQIAAGLAAAHEAGVVHRDVKPDNLLMTRDGRVTILDFGLAREQPLAEDGPGVTRAVTSAGTVLGTVAYMSPEQARGALADARSDQFSFGLVLYELASGRQAFARDSAVQTLTAIIEADPDLTPLATLPVQLRWIIERCLAKDPADRYASTADLYRELRQLRDRQSEIGRSGTQDIVAPPTRRRQFWPALAVIAGVAAGAFTWGRRDSATAIDAYRFVPFAVDAGVQSMPAWSPDGQSLAFSGEVDGYYQIFTRRLDQSTASQVTSLAGDCIYPTWDAGGTRVFFQLSQSAGQSLGANSSEVWMVSAAGGAPERLITSTAAFAVAPDGSSLVFLARPSANVEDGTYVLRAFDLQNRSTRELIPVPLKYDRNYNPTSRGLEFAPDGKSLALLKPGGDELVVLTNPLSAPGGVPRTVRFAPAEGGVVSLYEFDWMPDSRHVVLVLRDPRGGDQSLWMGDAKRGTLARITASSHWEMMPAASPDGARLAFSSTPLDWDIIEIDLASGASRPLIASARYDGWGDWMPDGSGLVFSTQRTGRFEIWQQTFRDGVARMVVTPDAFPGEPSLFLVQGAISPDGRSLAYVRFAPSGTRVYLTALAGSRPVQLTSEAVIGGVDDGPMWSPDGRWILFRRGSQLLKALASGGTAPSVVNREIVDSSMKSEGAAQWLPDGRTVIYSAADGLRQMPVDGGPSRLIVREQPMLWDVSPDGRMIYAILERDKRMMDLVTIDMATGALRTLQSLGRRPLTPDHAGYYDTVRALRVSPDGKRLMYARLNPTADIWILEGIGGRTPSAR
jgi:eukaryotic-like serine/threonine-protein kinase